MNSDFLDSLMYGTDADTLPAAPAVVHLSPTMLAPTPKKRGRPAKVAPPAMSLFQPLIRATSYIALSVRQDNAQGLSIVYGITSLDTIAVDYIGPNDRTLVMQLRDKVRMVDSDLGVTYSPPVGQWRELVASEVVDALTFVAPAMSTDETRYNLNGVFFDGARMVATDGHRLHLVEDAPVMCAHPAILPRWAVDTLQRAIKWTRCETIRTIQDKARIYFELTGECKRVSLAIQLVDGQFPDYRQVVPADSKTVAVNGDARALHATVAVAPRNATDKCAGMNIDFMPSDPFPRIEIVSHDKVDRVPLVMDGEVKEPVKITLNARYLETALNVMDGQVSINVADELSPVKLVNGPRMAIVMPMRR